MPPFMFRLFLVIIILLPLPAAGQVKFDINDITIQFGADVSQINNLKYDFFDFRDDYPETGLKNINLSSYHFDSSYFYWGIFPYSAEAETGMPVKGEKKIWKNASWRMNISCSRVELLFQNLVSEKIQNDVLMDYDTISRDFYSFSWIARFAGVGGGVQFNTRPLFKKQRDRFWTGLMIRTGVAGGTIYSHHSSGEYLGRWSGSENGVDQYEYFDMPALSYAYSSGSDRLPLKFYYGFEFPFGYERLLGKEKGFALGLCFTAGGTRLAGGGRGTVPLIRTSVMYTLRFMLP